VSGACRAVATVVPAPRVAVRACAATLLAVVVALAVAPVSTLAAKRAVPRTFFGMYWGDGIERAAPRVQDAAWNLMSRSGVETARVLFNWSLMQPERAGAIDFTATDAVVARAARTGIEILPVVMYAPAWARSSGEIAAPPRDNEAYAAFLHALIARYGRFGSFWRDHPQLPRRPIRYWQIWNEPTLTFQWAAPPGSEYAFPGGYVRLLRVAHRAVRSADSWARVVLAGLTFKAWEDLARVYRAGARGLFDVVAVQTYTGRPENLVLALRKVRKVMARHGDGKLALWVTETGWPAARGRVPVPSYQRPFVTDDRRAPAIVVRVHSLLARAARDRTVRVARVYWYSWVSRFSDPDNVFDYAGLLAWNPPASFVRKPVWRAYVRLVRKLTGCVRNTDGSCRRARTARRGGTRSR